LSLHPPSAARCECTRARARACNFPSLCIVMVHDREDPTDFPEFLKAALIALQESVLLRHTSAICSLLATSQEHELNAALRDHAEKPFESTSTKVSHMSYVSLAATETPDDIYADDEFDDDDEEKTCRPSPVMMMSPEEACPEPMTAMDVLDDHLLEEAKEVKVVAKPKKKRPTGVCFGDAAVIDKDEKQTASKDNAAETPKREKAPEVVAAAAPPTEPPPRDPPPPADKSRCACGNMYMPDATFCRVCGVRRKVAAPQAAGAAEEGAQTVSAKERTVGPSGRQPDDSSSSSDVEEKKVPQAKQQPQEKKYRPSPKVKARAAPEETQLQQPSPRACPQESAMPVGMECEVRAQKARLHDNRLRGKIGAGRSKDLEMNSPACTSPQPCQAPPPQALGLTNQSPAIKTTSSKPKISLATFSVSLPNQHPSIIAEDDTQTVESSHSGGSMSQRMSSILRVGKQNSEVRKRVGGLQWGSTDVIDKDDKVEKVETKFEKLETKDPGSSSADSEEDEAAVALRQFRSSASPRSGGTSRTRRFSGRSSGTYSDSGSFSELGVVHTNSIDSSIMDYFDLSGGIQCLSPRARVSNGMVGGGGYCRSSQLPMTEMAHAGGGGAGHPRRSSLLQSSTGAGHPRARGSFARASLGPSVGHGVRGSLLGQMGQYMMGHNPMMHHGSHGHMRVGMDMQANMPKAAQPVEDIVLRVLPVWTRTKRQLTLGICSQSQRLSAITDSANLDEGERRTGAFGDSYSRCLQRFVMQPNCVKILTLDLLGVVLIFYDLFYIPLQLLQPEETMFITCMDWTCRIFWTCNMPVILLVGFVHPDGDMEMAPKRILNRYAKSWLPFDCIVAFCDWGEVFVSGFADNNLTMVRAIRSARMLRIVRFFRIDRLLELASMLGETVRSETASLVVSICKIFFFVVCLLHLISCAWYGTGDLNSEGGWIRLAELENEGLWYRYATCVHWSLTQFVGNMEIYPTNEQERTYAIFVLFIAFMVSAAAVGSITSSMTRLQIIASGRSAQSVALRRFLLENQISQRLRSRVQQNVKHALSEQERNTPEESIDLLNIISEPLRMAVHYEVRGPIVSLHPFFDRFGFESPAVMRKVCHAAVRGDYLSPGDCLFVSGESPNEPQMYFLTRGTMVYTSISPEQEDIGAKPTKETLAAGQWVAEPVLWCTWMHRGMLRATSECTLLALDARCFQTIVSQYHTQNFHPSDYAAEFVKHLNMIGMAEDGVLSDLDADNLAATVLQQAYHETVEEIEARQSLLKANVYKEEHAPIETLFRTANHIFQKRSSQRPSTVSSAG